MIPSIEIGLTGGVGLRVRTAAILLIASTACAQGPTPPPLVAHETASEAMSPDPVSPNRVSTENTGTLQSQLEIPPLPKGKATLLGGTIASVDHVRDRLVLQIFGGGNTSVLFDERTRVFRDGRTATTDDLKSGLRAYVDTTLDGTKIFAKNIRVVPSAPAGQSSGQIVAFDAQKRELTLRDALSPERERFHIAPNATIMRGDHPATLADLEPGTLVSLDFSAGVGDLPRIQQVSILATPGTAFVFSGRIEFLDLRRGLLVLVDPRDNKSYEVNFDPSLRSLTQDLNQGVEVTVEASFDGRQYKARSITRNQSSP